MAIVETRELGEMELDGVVGEGPQEVDLVA
jgi:hypothetical protein